MNLLERLDNLITRVRAAFPECDASAVCQDLAAAREKLEHLDRYSTAAPEEPVEPAPEEPVAPTA